MTRDIHVNAMGSAPHHRAAAAGPLPARQFSLPQLLWCVSLAALLAGAFVASRNEVSDGSVLIVYGASLVAQAGFLILEARDTALRWFCLGCIAGVVATSYAAFSRGTMAFVIYVVGPMSHNSLRPLIETATGSLLVAAGLSITCGIVVGSIRAILSGRRILGVISLLVLGIWLVLWNLAVAAREVVLL
jgi:hypothetical protein